MKRSDIFVSGGFADIAGEGTDDAILHLAGTAPNANGNKYVYCLVKLNATLDLRGRQLLFDAKRETSLPEGFYVRLYNKGEEKPCWSFASWRDPLGKAYRCFSLAHGNGSWLEWDAASVSGSPAREVDRLRFFIGVGQSGAKMDLSIRGLRVVDRGPLVPRDARVSSGPAPSSPDRAFSVIVGTIARRSELPEAAKSDYPNCFYASKFKVAGTVAGKATPEDIILVFRGFKDRKYEASSAYRDGDLIKAKALPFDDLPDNIKSTQQANSIDDYDSTVYFAESSEKVDALPAISVLTPPAKQTGVAAGQLPPSSKRSDSDARRRAMRQDIEAIDALLQSHGGDWDKWFAELAPARTTYPKEYAGKWLGNSYFASVTADGVNDKFEQVDSYLEAMRSLNAFFRDRNIDFAVVLVPFRSYLTMDIFTNVMPDDKVINPYYLRLVKTLLENDIEVIDPLPLALKTRFEYPLMYFYNSKADNHPAEGMMWCAAKTLSDRLTRYDLPRGGDRYSLCAGQWPSFDKTPHGVWPKGNDAFPAGEKITFATVFDRVKSAAVVPQEAKNSPILIMGDSFMFYPNMYQGAGFPNYLAYCCGVAPDVLYRDGSSPGMARFIQQKPADFISGRRICVLIHNSSYVTRKWTKIMDFNATSRQKAETIFSSRTDRRFVSIATAAQARDINVHIVDNVLTLTPNSRQGTVTMRMPPMALPKAGKLFVTVSFKRCPAYSGMLVSVNRQEQFIRVTGGADITECLQFDAGPGNAEVSIRLEVPFGVMAISEIALNFY